MGRPTLWLVWTGKRHNNPPKNRPVYVGAVLPWAVSKTCGILSTYISYFMLLSGCNMTIRRRLFLSNVLMIAIPAILSLILVTITANLILDRFGLKPGPTYGHNDVFYRTISQMRALSDEWAASEPSSIGADMESFRLPEKSEMVSIALYRGGQQLYQVGGFTETPLFDAALQAGDTHHYTLDHTALYALQAGEYTVYLTNNAHEYNEAWRLESDDTPYTGIGIFATVLVLILIIATNSILTRLVFRSLITPLDTLVQGVHEIRDGNLDYRIHYTRKDEFASVCDDFNAMAGQIQELMEARKRDDTSRRELVAGISHDLRTPLTSIRTYAEGLVQGVAATPVMQGEYLNTIIAKTDDLEHIVQQLFLFSKLDVGDFPFQKEVVDIGLALEGFVSGVSTLYARQGLTITLEPVERQNYVEVDPVQMRTVFTNLLENTVKYGAEKNNRMNVACVQTDNVARIMFRDNGPGVPAEALDQLFQVFYRASRSRTDTGALQGNGLGLAISAKIIERFGGSIHAENAESGGLCIVIELPLLEGQWDE